MSGSEAPSGTVRLATRGSRLALWQAEHVSSLLRQAHEGLEIELIIVSTVGDRDRLSPLTQFGGEGAFTREVQAAVLEGRADVAVHSLKDLPTEPAAGLVLGGVPSRGPRFDVLLLPAGVVASSLDDLPRNARIGTGSLRRRAQLLHVRQDLVMVDVRGNVETRIRKLDERKDYDALVLAEAGLDRLGLAERISLRLGPPSMLPAVGQAALGLECRSDDEATRERLAAITDPDAFAEVRAERSCLRTLRAGCHAPVGALTQVSSDGTHLTIEAVVLSTDGLNRLVARSEGPADQPERIGERVARQLLQEGGDELLAMKSP